MSWLIDRPSPVPSPAGLVVKNGLNILSFTSGGMPVPLSRMRISTAVAEIFGGGAQRRLETGLAVLRPALGRGIKAVGDQIQEYAGDFLRKQLDHAGVGVEIALQRDVEVRLFGAGAVIGEVEAFIDQRVDVGGPVLAAALARMQQHVLDDGVGALAVLDDFFEIVLQQAASIRRLRRGSSRRARPA